MKISDDFVSMVLYEYGEAIDGGIVDLADPDGFAIIHQFLEANL